MYDLAIIGGGPAGYVAAEKAGKKGLKTVVFDKRELGGVCLNEGCIPTKTLLYTAKLYENALYGDKYGINCENVSFDFKKIMQRKDKVVKKLVGGVGAKMKSNKVDVVKEFASMKTRTKEGIVIDTQSGDFLAKNILLATGSEAAVPPIPGLKDTKFYTNREILQIDKLPESINIIGGGVIGVEFANFFAAMGTQVHVYEMMEEILPSVDGAFCKLLKQELTKKGVSFHTSSKVTKVDGNKLFYEENGAEKSQEAEMLLVAVGRKTNTEGIGLEKIGIETIRNGVKIDQQCRTNVQNVYAAGDITGFSLLAHTASREGEVVVHNLTGRKDVMRYDAVPNVIYTNPEIASVGLTEELAKKKGIAYKKAELPMAYAGRFIAENEGKSGFCNILVGERYNEILGVHMIGNPSSEMIYGAAMAIEMQMRVEDMEEIIFPHPTVSEIFKETVGSF